MNLKYVENVASMDDILYQAKKLKKGSDWVTHELTKAQINLDKRLKFPSINYKENAQLKYIEDLQDIASEVQKQKRMETNSKALKGAVGAGVVGYAANKYYTKQAMKGGDSVDKFIEAVFKDKKALQEEGKQIENLKSKVSKMRDSFNNDMDSMLKDFVKKQESYANTAPDLKVIYKDGFIKKHPVLTGGVAIGTAGIGGTMLYRRNKLKKEAGMNYEKVLNNSLFMEKKDKLKKVLELIKGKTLERANEAADKANITYRKSLGKLHTVDDVDKVKGKLLRIRKTKKKVDDMQKKVEKATNLARAGVAVGSVGLAGGGYAVLHKKAGAVGKFFEAVKGTKVKELAEKVDNVGKTYSENLNTYKEFVKKRKATGDMTKEELELMSAQIKKFKKIKKGATSEVRKEYKAAKESTMRARVGTGAGVVGLAGAGVLVSNRD